MSDAVHTHRQIATLGQIEARATASLIPYARNSRVHPEAQLAQIEASIRQWGFTIPILVDEDDGVIAGHGRLVVAHRTGMPEVPVLVARGWSEEQKRAYVIADNKIPLGAEWDPIILAAEMMDLQALSFDTALIGFDADELLSLLNPPEPAPAKARARRRSRGGPEVEVGGVKLDEAIAEIERGRDPDWAEPATWFPSTKWEQAGPILERERIDLRCKPGVDGGPDVWTGNAPGFLKESDESPLVAGLRAVLAKHRAAGAS